MIYPVKLLLIINSRTPGSLSISLNGQERIETISQGLNEYTVILPADTGDNLINLMLIEDNLSAEIQGIYLTKLEIDLIKSKFEKDIVYFEDINTKEIYVDKFKSFDNNFRLVVEIPKYIYNLILSKINSIILRK